jgi:hypothetical protein
MHSRIAVSPPRSFSAMCSVPFLPLFGSTASATDPQLSRCQASHWLTLSPGFDGSRGAVPVSGR